LLVSLTALPSIIQIDWIKYFSTAILIAACCYAVSSSPFVGSVYANDSSSPIETTNQQIETTNQTESKKTPTDSEQTSTPSPCSSTDSDRLSWFDRTHLALSRRACNQAKRLDRFFGDLNYDSDNATSFFRVRNNFIWQRSTETEFEFLPRIKARIYLPSTQQRFNIIISDDTENLDSISSSSDAQITTDDNANRVSTALRWIIPYTDFVQANLDVGARFSDGITTFVRMRSRKTFRIDERTVIKASETLFWIDHVGFGERTQIDYERTLSDTLFLRWTSAATFSQASEGIDFSQRFTFYKELSSKRAISYYVGMKGSTHPYPLLEDFGLGIRYRKNIYKNWLFTEIEPELFWPLEEDRITSWRFTFRIEAQFGEEPASKSK